MAAYEIAEVLLAPKPPEGLRGAALEAPRPGEPGDVFAFPLSGLVLGTDSRAVAVEVVCDGRVIQTARVSSTLEAMERRRPGTTAEHPDVPSDTPCGFETLISVIGLEPEFELHVMAVLEDDARVGFAFIRGRHEPLRPPFSPRLQPLMVTSPGRTGTTWLIGMLSAHPAIVVHDEYPYEAWLSKYWTHVMKVLADPADHGRSARPHGFDIDLFHAGRNPFFTRRTARHPALGRWLGRSYPERLAAFFQATIEDWYEMVAVSQGLADVRYFAEKQMTRLSVAPVLIWELYPQAKEVFLVRDFRDMACSKIAFGTAEPGIVKGGMAGKTLEQYLREIVLREALAFQRAWDERGERGHLVRYEDLVFRPAQTLSSLLEYLELEAADPIIDRMLESSPKIRLHRTTPDVQASVGRWQQEDEAFKALCRELFGNVLVDFGYDLESVPG